MADVDTPGTVRRTAVSSADGLRLSVTDQGPVDAPALLMIHGTGMRARTWRRVCHLLARAGHRCLAVDLRGHGQSDWSRTGDYSLGVHASDLGDVARQLHLSPYVVVGMSLGAAVSLAHAGMHPAGLAGLVLVDAGPMRSRAAGRERLQQTVFSVQPRHAYDPRARWWTQSADTSADEVESRIAQRVALLWSAAASLDVPTLVVRGADSDLFAPDDARATVEALPRARLVEIPEAGHFVHRDQPDALVRALTTFLRSDVRAESGGHGSGHDERRRDGEDSPARQH